MPARQDTMTLRAEIAGWKALGMIPSLMAKLLVYQYGWFPSRKPPVWWLPRRLNPAGVASQQTLVYDDPEEGAS